MDQQTTSYYEQRLASLGITPENNKVDLIFGTDEKGNQEMDPATGSFKIYKRPVEIFRKHDKGIEIIAYTLLRELITIKTEASRFSRNWSIIRLENPVVKADKSEMKYQMPKGHGSYPFFPPSLVDKYEQKAKIETLFITEGFFKAFKGAMHGIDIVGLASITHLKSKETGALHPEILKLIHACDIKRVVWLVDGDVLDLSNKASDPKNKIDLYRRPSQFFASINTFKQLLDDYEVDKYFLYVDTDGIYTQENFLKEIDKKTPRENFKGLDDILIECPDKITEIVADIHTFSKPGSYFQKFNIDAGLSKVRNLFNLGNVVNFYLYHVQKNTWLKNTEFLYNGTKFRYNEDKGECDIIIPGDASKYFRVGDNYYMWITRKNIHKTEETYFKSRQKSTITDDHGKNFLKHVVKYHDFINIPDHINYQPNSDGCFNVYQRLDYEPDAEPCTEADCPTIISYMTHLFGTREIHFTHPVTKEKKSYTNIDLGLDYVQLLYQKPWLKLPILCLVSKENNTGKSTFAHLLRIIFSSNCAIVGNQDLAGDFNAHWCTKLIVACDETKIDKHSVIDKVKSLSTAPKITLNSKGKDQNEIDCFIKFIFITNNEENFIYLTDDDIRYWVNKIPVLKQENPTILDSMTEEIPAFLSFLNQRKLVTDKLNRMWFHPSLLKTEALKRVVANSGSTPKKEILQKLKDMFFDFGVEEIMMTRKAIHEEFFKGRYEANYIEKVLKDELKVEQYHIVDAVKKNLFGEPIKKYIPKRHSYPRWGKKMGANGVDENIRVDVNDNGRVYVFKRDDFLTPDEISSISVSAEDTHLNEMTVKSNEEIPIPELPQNEELPF